MINLNVIAVAECVTHLANNESVKKFMCGTYSDGTARSLSDCLNGEVLSPKDKAKKIYKKRKKHKKGKADWKW